ncbi:hypothetical protein DID80_08025 [Candidatus Marinamargulisbacteria bacterium SCGC AAA071-K20]|nr:hypothetical protein DID80_08025 [Candidatus Marinamargulisbacteria bacterium SCGC AAA071-K20]
METLEELFKSLVSKITLKERAKIFTKLLIAFENESTRPPIETLSKLVNENYKSKILELHSYFLLHYLPSTAVIPIKDQDALFQYMNSCDQELREKDKEFLTTLLTKELNSNNTLKSGFVNTILRVMVKCSGIYDKYYFEKFYVEFQRNHGYFPVELAMVYTNEKKGIDPESALHRFLQLGAVFLDIKTLVNLLNIVCEREDEKYFDLELLWLSYDKYFNEADTQNEGPFLATCFDLLEELKLKRPEKITYTIYSFEDEEVTN